MCKVLHSIPIRTNKFCISSCPITYFRIIALNREKTHQTNRMNIFKCFIPINNIVPCPLETAIGIIISFTPSIVISHRNLNIWRCCCNIISMARVCWVFITFIISFTIICKVRRECSFEVQSFHEI